MKIERILYKFKNTRTIILLVFLFATAIANINAQEITYLKKYLSVDTVINISNYAETSVRNIDKEVITFCTQEYYYFAFKNKKETLNQKINIYRVNLSDFRIDTLFCEIDKQSSKKIKNHTSIETMRRFIVLHNKVLVFTGNSLITFYSEDCKNYKYFQIFPFDDIYQNIEHLNEDTFVLEEINNPQCFFTIIDNKQKKIKKQQPVQFIAPAFTHLAPNSFFSVKTNKIAFSQAVKYEIDFYDTRGVKINTIKKQDSEWKQLSDDKIEMLNKCEPGAVALDKVYFISEEVSRILGIKFLNDSMLMVWYYPPVAGKTIFQDVFLLVDIWLIKSNGNNILLHEKLADGWDNTLIKPLSNKDIPLLIHYELSGNFDCNDKKILILRNEADIYQIGYSKQEYLDYCEHYFLKNYPQLKIYVFSYDFNH